MACSDQEPKVQVESQGYGNDGLRGEIETMKVLNAISPLVPQAFRPKLENCFGPHKRGVSLFRFVFVLNDSLATIDYFFVQHMSGTACSPTHPKTVLLPNSLPKPSSISPSSVSPFRTQPFRGVGSLDQDGEVVPWIKTSFCRMEPPFFCGPFKTVRERYLAFIDHILKEIEAGSELEEEAMPAYLAHLDIEEVVLHDEEMGREEVTYLKHADDKGDQIMVDEDGHITAVIDWEW